MAPTLQNGDFLLAKVTVLPSRLKADDIIVLHRPNEGPMVKRIIDGDQDSGFAIKGDNVLSAPKIDLGKVFPEHILGKGILKISKSGSGFL